MKKPVKMKLRKVIGYAIVDEDGDIPSMQVGTVGDILHVHNHKKEAEVFVKKLNNIPHVGDNFWRIARVEIKECKK